MVQRVFQNPNVEAVKLTKTASAARRATTTYPGTPRRWKKITRIDDNASILKGRHLTTWDGTELPKCVVERKALERADGMNEAPLQAEPNEEEQME